jgi:predicted transposase YdaD
MLRPKKRNEYEKREQSYIVRQIILPAEADGLQQGRKEGKEEKEVDAVLGMNENNITVAIIAKSLKITEEKVRQIIETYANK